MFNRPTGWWSVWIYEQSHFIVCIFDQKWPAENNMLISSKEKTLYVLVDAIYMFFRRFHNRHVWFPDYVAFQSNQIWVNIIYPSWCNSRNRRLIVQFLMTVWCRNQSFSLDKLCHLLLNLMKQRDPKSNVFIVLLLCFVKLAKRR